MLLTDENFTEEELNQFCINTEEQFTKNKELFNEVHLDIKELFDSIEDDICLGILSKLEEFKNIFKLIENIMFSFKIIINKYSKYYEKNQKKKLEILQLKNEKEHLQQELLNNYSEIDKKENEFNTLQNDYLSVLKRIDSLNSNNNIDISFDNTSNSKTDSPIRKKKEKSSKNTSLLNEIKNLKNMNDELNDTILILKNNYEELKIDNSNLKDKLISANKQIESDNEKIDFFQSKENKLKSEINKLKSIIIDLKKEIEILFNENTFLKSEVNHLSKQEQSLKNLNISNFDYNSYQKNKAKEKKNEEDEKEENIISLNSIGYSNDLEKQNKEEEKINNLKKINITPKEIVKSMNKDFKSLTNSKKLENNYNDRSYSYFGNGVQKNDNRVIENYYMYDYFF